MRDTGINDFSLSFNDDHAVTVRACRPISAGKLVTMPREAFEALWRQSSPEQRSAYLRCSGTSSWPFPS